MDNDLATVAIGRTNFTFSSHSPHDAHLGHYVVAVTKEIGRGYVKRNADGTWTAHSFDYPDAEYTAPSRIAAVQACWGSDAA